MLTALPLRASLSHSVSRTSSRTGRYKLRVVSNGNAELFPIHVVNEKTPSLVLSDTGAYSGVNTHFTVKDMLYGITQPIYRVELQYAGDSEVQVLNKFDDWYLIGDTFVLYNDTTNHLTHSGKYTLTIYANGFKSFSQTFYAYGADKQSVSPAARAAAAGVDALSAATSGGGASSDSGSEGGSNTMNANLVFSADLLTNAKIVEKLGLDNANAAAISERWDNMLHDAVYYEGADKVYTSAGFFAAANTARTEDKLLTFAEYVTSENAETTRNRPYAVKKVLEDNLLGETTSFSEASSSAAPDLTLVKEVTKDGQTSYQSINEVNEGEDAVLLVSGSKAAAYLEKLKENADSQLYLNTTSALSKDVYSIDTEKNTITIKADKLKLGDNALTLQVDTFQKVRLTLTVAKQLEKNLSLSVAETTESGKPVVVFTVDGSNGDFLKNLASVKLDDKTDIGTYGYYGYGSETAYYVIGKDNKTISLYNVPSGEHTVAISAKYYGEPLTAKFTVNAKPAEAAKSAPTVSSAEKKTDSDFYGTAYSFYRLSFTNTSDPKFDLAAYLKAVTVTINGEKFDPMSYSTGAVTEGKYRLYAAEAAATGGSISDYDSLDLPAFAAGTYNIKLTADGYTDVEYTLTVGDSSSSGGSAVTAPTELPTIEKTQDSSGNQYYLLTFSDAAEWLRQLDTITVDGSEYKVGGDRLSTKTYRIDADNQTIAMCFPSELWSTTYNVVFVGTNTTSNLTLKITIPGFTGEPSVSK